MGRNIAISKTHFFYNIINFNGSLQVNKAIFNQLKKNQISITNRNLEAYCCKISTGTEQCVFDFMVDGETLGQE